MTVILTAALISLSHAGTVEGIAAVVNGKAITITDLEEEMAIRKQLTGRADRAEAIDTIIEREIVSPEAGKLGLTVNTDEVTRDIVRFEDTFRSREELDRFLEVYDMNLHDLARRFTSSIAVDKVREQKGAISADRYEKWLGEMKKKADIRIMDIGN